MEGGMTRDWIDRDGTEAAAEAYVDPNDPRAIRADIERTRERMSGTVDELGERLNPDRLKGKLKQNIHHATIGKAENMARMAVDRVEGTRHSMMDSIRDNPLPAAMVGIGLGWLFLNSRRDDETTMSRSTAYRDPGYRGATLNPEVHSDPFAADFEAGYSADSRRVEGEPGLRQTTREKGEEIRHRTEELAHNARDRVTEVAHDAGDQARHAVDRAHDVLEASSHRARDKATGIASDTRRRAHRVEDRFEETLRDSPLAIGAAAVAIGMAVGLGAPSTRRESELMGSRRDELMNRTRRSVAEMGDRARDVADRVVDDARSTISEEVDRSGMS